MTDVPTSYDMNPVLMSELRYQRFVIENSRSGWFWIVLALLMVAPSLLLSIGYALAAVFKVLPIIAWNQIPNTPHLNLFLLLIVVNVSMYTVVTLVTMGLSNRSIGREKTQHTWALLRMTDIHPTQIVLGKWWASLWALNGDHLMVIILRVGLLGSYFAVFLPSLHANQGVIAPYHIYFLALLPLVILHGVLDAALSAILGVMGAIPDGVLQSITTFSVMIMRLLLGVGVGVWFWQILTMTHTNILAALRLAAIGIVATGSLIILCVALAQWLMETR